MPRDYRRVLDTLDTIEELYDYEEQDTTGSRAFVHHVRWAYRDLASFSVQVTPEEAVQIVERLARHQYNSFIQLFQIASNGKALLEIQTHSKENVEWIKRLNPSREVIVKVNP